MPDDLLTTRQAAELLGRSTASVRSYIRFCGFPARKLGVQNFTTRADLDEWKSRPEIADMLAAGDYTYKRRRRLAASA